MLHSTKGGLSIRPCDARKNPGLDQESIADGGPFMREPSFYNFRGTEREDRAVRIRGKRPTGATAPALFVFIYFPLKFI